MHTYSTLNGKHLTFFVTPRRRTGALSKHCFEIGKFFPLFGGENSGKFFPLYGFATDPFPTFGEKFPQIFFQWTLRDPVMVAPCRIGLSLHGTAHPHPPSPPSSQLQHTGQYNCLFSNLSVVLPFWGMSWCIWHCIWRINVLIRSFLRTLGIILLGLVKGLYLWCDLDKLRAWIQRQHWITLRT